MLALERAIVFCAQHDRALAAVRYHDRWLRSACPLQVDPAVIEAVFATG